MATVYDFLNPDSTEVEEQRIIRAPGATADDVLTVQADGTISPAPGGGALPVNGVNILRIPQTITAAEAALAWDTGAATIPLTEYVPLEGDTVLWLRLRRLVLWGGGADDFKMTLDTVGGLGGIDPPTWDLIANTDALQNGWWVNDGADFINGYFIAKLDVDADPLGLVAVVYSDTSGAAPDAGESILECLVARAPA